MRFKIILFLFLCFATLPVLAQLSQGGSPIAIQQLKVAGGNEYVELHIPDSEIELVEKLKTGKMLEKAFRFAYAIPVDFSTQNSGTWIESGDYKVWQLKLESPGALSLNVIFNRYYLPEGARLFLYSEDQNDVLGAFTSQNNKADGILATMPVEGDKLIIQYEEPLDADFSGELELQSVNHDFAGLKAYSGGRRPLGESGTCNVNVKCDYLDQYRDAADAVCRILIAGTELCTGTLLNNTQEDGTPYLYTANHCIQNSSDASKSVFLFNYESPYCQNIDGEVLNSISSSSLKATSTELDFSLVELSVEPPKSFQPYFLGWDRSSTVPDSTVSIHHPLGDIKKVAIDRDSPVISSYSSDYLSGAFWKVRQWEEGTTESGSSGAGLIDPDLRVRGSLVGGEASCDNPVNDYFSQFRYAWDNFSSSDMQLKSWLDPNNTGATSLNGMDPFAEEEQCTVVTNLKDNDLHVDGLIDQNNEGDGYYSGTNSFGFSEFAESFQFDTSCKIQGLTLGVSRKSITGSGAFLTISVYEGGDLPGSLIYSQDFSLSGVVEGVMNYFSFDEEVSTDGSFYLAWSIENMNSNDIFAVYLAERSNDSSNTYFIFDGGEWYSFQDKSNTQSGTAAVIEALVCYQQTEAEVDPFGEEDLEFVAYPNPLRFNEELVIRFQDEVEPVDPEIFDLLGRSCAVNTTSTEPDRIAISFNAFRPGIYFVRLTSATNGTVYSQKVLYLGGE
ncbi:T9SS type A sorting domain-containing protein [Mangrovibacterium sp.]|uniref:T9SS type A sorting domain-containing protein n=1 Tax=Mangrovibacterium sp. TaxID=1961364 RepID=UPI0035669C8D